MPWISRARAYVPELVENQFVILKADQSAKKTHLGRVEKGVIKKLDYRKSSPYGITPRNAGQYFLQEALMQPQRKRLCHREGHGRNQQDILFSCGGLEKLLNHPSGEYRRILICRPNAQFDDDIGFLPGDEQEKISPLMRPVIDNLEQLIDSSEEERYDDEEELRGQGGRNLCAGNRADRSAEFYPGTVYRKDISDNWMRAQNTTPDQIKGIITRAGKDTKIILLGDPNQIDRSFLDERTNGLSYASETYERKPFVLADHDERAGMRAFRACHGGCKAVVMMLLSGKEQVWKDGRI